MSGKVTVIEPDITGTVPLANVTHEFFVRALIAYGGSIARAAESAGFSAAAGYKAKQRPDVKLRFDWLFRNYLAVLGITEERILYERYCTGFFNFKDAFDSRGQLKAIADMPEELQRAITGIEMESKVSDDDEKLEVTRLAKIKVCNKDASLDSLMKHKGMFEKNNKQQRTVLKIGRK